MDDKWRLIHAAYRQWICYCCHRSDGSRCVGLQLLLQPDSAALNWFGQRLTMRLL